MNFWTHLYRKYLDYMYFTYNIMKEGIGNPHEGRPLLGPAKKPWRQDEIVRIFKYFKCFKIGIIDMIDRIIRIGRIGRIILVD